MISGMTSVEKAKTAGSVMVQHGDGQGVGSIPAVFMEGH